MRTQCLYTQSPGHSKVHPFTTAQPHKIRALLYCYVYLRTPDYLFPPPDEKGKQEADSRDYNTYSSFLFTHVISHKAVYMFYQHLCEWKRKKGRKKRKKKILCQIYTRVLNSPSVRSYVRGGPNWFIGIKPKSAIVCVQKIHIFILRIYICMQSVNFNILTFCMFQLGPFSHIHQFL